MAGPEFTMVAFSTLFLGLLLGSQAVEVVAEEPVASVELLLDGESMARRTEPPWIFEIDFGDAYEPHVLEAVGRAADGTEVGRAEQWLNIPRREAEAEILLSGGEEGRNGVARVLWESRIAAEPERIEASFDGRPLTVVDPERIPLPAHDPEALHLLRIELHFAGGYSTVAEKTFGGVYAEEIETRLTAVPVVLAKGGKTPTPPELQGLFRGPDGDPLEVVAIDEGPADVVVVRDAAAQAILDELFSLRTGAGLRQTRGGVESKRLRQLRYLGRLKKRQRIRFLYPVAIETVGHRTRQEQFPTSRLYAPSDGGLAWLMVRERKAVAPDEQRLAEAVAVAGMAAALDNHSRAVVLLLARNSPDRSRITAAGARGYLESLRVPLAVWALDSRSDSGPWGAQRAVRNLADLQRSIRDLASSLDRQRMVWLRGRYLPQTITLRDDARFRLAQEGE